MKIISLNGKRHTKPNVLRPQTPFAAGLTRRTLAWALTLCLVIMLLPSAVTSAANFGNCEDCTDYLLLCDCGFCLPCNINDGFYCSDCDWCSDCCGCGGGCADCGSPDDVCGCGFCLDCNIKDGYYCSDCDWCSDCCGCGGCSLGDCHECQQTNVPICRDCSWCDDCILEATNDQYGICYVCGSCNLCGCGCGGSICSDCGGDACWDCGDCVDCDGIELCGCGFCLPCNINDGFYCSDCDWCSECCGCGGCNCNCSEWGDCDPCRFYNNCSDCWYDCDCDCVGDCGGCGNCNDCKFDCGHSGQSLCHHEHICEDCLKDKFWYCFDCDWCDCCCDCGGGGCLCHGMHLNLCKARFQSNFFLVTNNDAVRINEDYGFSWYEAAFGDVPEALAFEYVDLWLFPGWEYDGDFTVNNADGFVWKGEGFGLRLLFIFDADSEILFIQIWLKDCGDCGDCPDCDDGGSGNNGGSNSGGGSSPAPEPSPDPSEGENGSGGTPPSFDFNVENWTNIFADLNPAHPYFEALAFMNLNGLMVGYGNGNVGADDTLTRAQFATLLWNLEGQPAPNGTADFDDVEDGAWYGNPVAWAAEMGVVAGTGGGLFDPYAPITRQEIIQMLYNFAVNFKGLELPADFPMPDYTDADQLDAWAESAAKALAEAGVLPDSDELRPGDDATRGEMADMFMRFVRFVMGG